MKSRFFVVSLGLWMLCSCPSQLRGQEVPAGTVLEIRLRDAVSSYTAKRGDALHAVLIAPVQQDGHDLLPLGADVYGSVVSVKRVGLGVIRERARLRLRFGSVVAAGRSPLAMDSQVVEVENAREQILADGTIVGIRATDSYGHQTAGLVSSAATVDPLLTLFAFAGASSVLRFPEAEITYPAGTELQLKLLQPLRVAEITPDLLSHVATTDSEQQSLASYVNELPFRTRTKNRNSPSDLTNLVFLGTRKQLLRAFASAGWTPAAELDPATRYEIVRALAESRAYAEAPMSRLLLGGEPPALVFEKTLNTINKRHHLRVWQIADGWNGQTVWTAAATHDIGIGFSSKKTLIHRIDSEIDKERSKVVNDLLFTGCVDGVDMLNRPQVPRVTYNATGDHLFTDGRVAVLRLRSCIEPRADNTRRPTNPAASTGNILYRGVRQFDLTTRNFLLRDNVAWQAYRGGRIVWKMTHHRSASQPATASLLPPETSSEPASEPHRAIAGQFPSAEAARETSRPRLPEVAFSLDGGQFLRLHLGDLFLASVDPNTGDVAVYQYSMRIEPGVFLGASVTLHPSQFLSHELFFGTAQANLLTGEDPTVQVDRLRIRTAGYQLEANLAPGRWRFRPFVTAGSSVTTYRFKNIKLSKKNGIFKFGLRRVGTIVSAFNSAAAAPLDGGTIFRLGLTYGGGIKYRISRLVEFRAEYRETYAKDPDFFNKESVSLSSQGISSAQDPGARRHGNYILSLAFTL
jgi:hypothetical protein